MMTLFFGHSRQNRRVIGHPTSEQQAHQMIRSFCDERNFKIYYTRMWKNSQDETVFDVGSWTEFFWLRDDEK